MKAVGKSNANLSEILTVNYLTGNGKINNKVISYGEFKRNRKMYMILYPENYNKLNKAMAAIYDDLEYFPVVKSKYGNYWVNFEDSFGEGRSYNGKVDSALISRSFAKIISKCTKVRPKERYQSTIDVICDLKRCRKSMIRKLIYPIIKKVTKKI